jgi:phospholipid/cholesterol/gamma-HCH transport system substrate-binding protein
MAARGASRDVAVGALFVLALTILALAVMALGEGTSLLHKQVQYLVTFRNVEGLGLGSPVKMNGVQVGTVSGIRLSEDPERGGIAVELGIDQKYQQRVRSDTEASLRILQLLSGEKFVEVFPGDSTLPELPPGSEIPVHDDPEVFAEVTAASQNINDISVLLKSILAKLESGEGLLGQMITNPDFGQEGLESLKGAMDNIEGLSADLRSGKGFVGRLLTDDEFAGKIDSLGETVDGLARVVARIDADKGAIGELLREDGSGKQAIQDLAAASGSLKRVASSLESSDGFIGKMINDEEYGEKLASDLAKIVGNLAEVSEKINNGDGTLGALVNERTLHEGLEDVVAGVNDSKFARWLLRHYQKKGIKSESGDEATTN